MNPQIASFDQIKNTVLDLAIRFGPKLLVAILILIVGVAVSRWVSRWLLRALARIELEPPVRALLARVGWVLSFALFLIMALENLGVELLPLIAGLGVAGAGIALATQGVLSNVVAGLSIIFTKPFRVGEYISIVHEEGQVQAITLFNTTLTHTDRSRIVIPNRKIVGEILHNFGNLRQVNVSVGVAYDTDINGALAAIGEVLRANSARAAGSCSGGPDDPARGVRGEHRRAPVGTRAGLRPRHRRDHPGGAGIAARARHRHALSATRSASHLHGRLKGRRNAQWQCGTFVQGADPWRTTTSRTRACLTHNRHRARAQRCRFRHSGGNTRFPSLCLCRVMSVH